MVSEATTPRSPKSMNGGAAEALDLTEKTLTSDENANEKLPENGHMDKSEEQGDEEEQEPEEQEVPRR